MLTPDIRLTLKQFWMNERKIRFLVIGSVNTLFGLIVFPALLWMSGALAIHYLILLCASYLLSILFSFSTNKFFVFKSSGDYFGEYTRFFSLHIIFFIMNFLALPFLIELVGLKPLIAQLMLSFIAAISSYFWHKNITFRSQMRCAH
jgi:putative flippase GtrA